METWGGWDWDHQTYSIGKGVDPYIDSPPVSFLGEIMRASGLNKT